MNEARHHSVCGQLRTDEELVRAVQRGDAHAYGALYQRHEPAVRRLALRLSHDRHEADDVVSEVFANTLRALQHGHGPTDDFGAYALRSVRNTLSKLRTRTDTAHALPTEHSLMDRAAAGDSLRLSGDVEHAFQELPDRFQAVLWRTCVEGHTPTDLADGEALNAGAVAALSNRARRALGRSYLRVHTDRPCRQPECKRVRSNLPGYVQHLTTPSSVRRIETHLRQCSDCATVRDEMAELNVRLRATGWWSLWLAVGRQAAMSMGSLSAPALATAAAAPVAALIVAGAVVTDIGTREPAPSDEMSSVLERSTSIDAPAASNSESDSDPSSRPTIGTSSDTSASAADTAVGGNWWRPTTNGDLGNSSSSTDAPPFPIQDATSTGPTTTPGSNAHPTGTPLGGRLGGVLLEENPTGAIADTGTAPRLGLGATATTVVDDLVIVIAGVGGTVNSALVDPSQLDEHIVGVTDDTTDLVGGTVTNLVGTVDGVGGVVGVNTSPVTGPVVDLVDDTLVVTDEIVGSAGGTVGDLIDLVLPPGQPPAPDTPPPPAAPGLLPGLIGGIGGLLGG